jgi:hypothetical protein
MNDTSFAAQAVANQRAIAENAISHSGLAQPGFVGQEWLVAFNLGIMTAGFFLCLMLSGSLAQYGWRCRHRDSWGSPANVARRIILAFALSGVLRYGGEAASLWGWDPSDPRATIRAAYTKRILDMPAAILFWTGLAMAVLGSRSFLMMLRRDPLPVKMWATLPQLGRPVAVVVLSFAAAIGVVLTR